MSRQHEPPNDGGVRKREKTAIVPNRRNFPVRRHVCWHRVARSRRDDISQGTLKEELSMGGIIYLVGLIVIIMAILSLFGLR
jgi:hypothetical protein